MAFKIIEIIGRHRYKVIMAYIIKTHAIAGQGFVIDFRDFKGKPTLHYQGVPILLCDAIKNTEGA